MSTLIHLRQPLDVQLAATAEHPHGRVVRLEPDADGFCEVDDGDAELATHPVVSRLAPATDDEAARRSGMRAARVARDEAIARARADYAEAVRGLASRGYDEAVADAAARAVAITGGPSEVATADVAQVATPGDGDQASRRVASPRGKSADKE